VSGGNRCADALAHQLHVRVTPTGSPRISLARGPGRSDGNSSPTTGAAFTLFPPNPMRLAFFFALKFFDI
jgi:hypothetical protein